MVQLKIWCLISLLIATSSIAQHALPISRNIEKSYKNGVRSLTGEPGKAYWQNTSDYDIQADFNPATLFLKGNESIIYTNNSPDTLQEIEIKLYPNLYKKGAQTMMKLSGGDLNEGMTIEDIKVNNKSTIYSIDGTNMSVRIPPLLPKEKVNFKINFHYTLNKYSHVRTGQIDVNTAFVAYFFPRIAVYDDIDGWNRNQYVGTQEFYNDFCHFKVAISVPNGFVVWATGDLRNGKEVLQSKYFQRLQFAENNDSPGFIIDSSDLLSGSKITADQEKNTWLFDADNVTDFVFSTSNHYVWLSSSIIVDSSTMRRTRTDAVYNPIHHDYYDVLQYNRETVKQMSFSFPKWPFPYPHITVFDGLDQMEYPMMVNDNPLERFDAITTTDHEVFHTMFPFYMGINETKYGWMDEGWATLGEWLISPMIDSAIADDYGMKRYNDAAGMEEDLPITTLSTQLNGTPYFLNSYVKPALGYLYIKDFLGDPLFTKALHYYIAQWHGKHPMPNDFFNCFNTATGKNLNWFWKKWFFENGYPDLGISGVTNKAGKYAVTIERKGEKPVPIDLTIYLEDGKVLKEHRTISVWENGTKSTIVKLNTTGKIKDIVLGSLYIADVNKDDNVWKELKIVTK